MGLLKRELARNQLPSRVLSDAGVEVCPDSRDGRGVAEIGVSLSTASFTSREK